MGRFLITTFLIAASIIGVGYLIFDELPGFFYQTIILLFTTTVGLFRFLWKTKQKNPDFFVPVYLATIAIKLIAFVGYIFLMAKQQPEMIRENVVFFLIAYVIFTALETAFLYRFVSR